MIVVDGSCMKEIPKSEALTSILPAQSPSLCICQEMCTLYYGALSPNGQADAALGASEIGVLV